MKQAKRITALLLAIFMVCALAPPLKASAKTSQAQAASTIFFYVTNSSGEDILLKTADVSQLKTLEHGIDSETNYSLSYTDRLPSTCYAEAMGITLDELVGYMKENTITDQLTFQGSDQLCFMADDSGNTYTRTLTGEEASRVRKFVPGLYEGWKTFGASRWQDASDEEVTAWKKTAWNAGEEMPVILSVSSFSGRTGQEAGNSASSEGILEYVQQNGNVVKGCLSNAGKLNGDSALALYFPTTETSFMEGESTAYENFRWIYNIKLNMAEKPGIQSQGTVGKVKASFTPDPEGKTLTVSLSCDTPGAAIYYDLGTGTEETSLHKSAQTLYTGPFTVELPEDPAKSPVTFYTHAVKEGYTDAGNQSVSYYQSVPSVTKPQQTMLGEEDVILTANSGVTDEDWQQWTNAITGISVKLTTEDQYTAASYEIDDTKKRIVLSKDNFQKAGTYVIRAEAAEYKDGTWNATVKRHAPELEIQDYYDIGKDITITFDDSDSYHQVSQVKCRAAGSSNGVTISSSYLQKEQGKLTIKAAYFSVSSCPIKAAGDYVLSLTNGNYDPSPREAAITVIDQSAVSNAQAKIKAIGTVGDSSGAAIKAARAAYDALTTDAERSLVDYSALEAAEKAYEPIADMKASLGTVTGLKATSSAYNTAKLSWAKKSAAKGYVIYRAEGKGAYKKIVTITKNSTLSYTNKSLKTGTTYSYKVAAYGTVGGKTVTGGFSSVKSVKPVLKKTSVTLKAGKKQAVVKWKKVAGASGYQVQRSIKKKSGYKTVKTVTKGSTVKYTNKKLKKGKRYYYRVRAYRKVSGKKIYSSYSAVKSVKVK